jgi:hypothetical protein
MDGVKVRIGEQEFVVPKLRVGTHRRVTEIVQEIDGIDPRSTDPKDQVRWFGAHVRAIIELLRRNYPDASEEMVADLIDCDNVQGAFFAVMAAAGRRADEKGEAAGP